MADPASTSALELAVSAAMGFGVKTIIDYFKEERRNEAVSTLKERVTRLEARLDGMVERLETQAETARGVAADLRSLLHRLQHE